MSDVDGGQVQTATGVGLAQVSGDTIKAFTAGWWAYLVDIPSTALLCMALQSNHAYKPSSRHCILTNIYMNF